MNESIIDLASKYGLTTGSTWIFPKFNVLLTIISDDFEEKEWCYAICIPMKTGVIYEKLYFWAYLIGLAKTEEILKIA
jgi:hypothetical protein